MTIARRAFHSVTHYRPDRCYNGFTLYSPLYMNPTTVFLIDMKGHFVHSWKTGDWVRFHAELLPNGNLLYAATDPDPPIPDCSWIGGHIVELDWDGREVWRYYCRWMDAHDRVRLKNGNTLLMRMAEVPGEIASKVKGGIPGSELDAKMYGYELIEVTPQNEVVWRWLSYEHLNPDMDILNVLFRRSMWPGWNSLEELPDGNIMACSYGTNNIYIIDKRTGDIKWRWGNGIISFPHNPTMLDNGNILIFDNNRYHTQMWPPDYSRVLEVNPETNTIEWEYSAPNPVDFFSTYVSGAQRMPNGNTVICEGSMGRFFEIAPSGDLVWEYISPFYDRGHIQQGKNAPSNCVFRCHRYGPDYPGLQGKRFTPEKLETYNLLHGPGPLRPSYAGTAIEASSIPYELPEDYTWNSARPSLAKTHGETAVSARAKMLGY